MKKYTILVVDDKPDNLQIIYDLLTAESPNYRIVKALNGKMACEVVKKRNPDLIITDWEMPEMNGIEMIKELKKNPSSFDIPIIMATGVMTSSEHLQTALRAGAVDYIRKPIDSIELAARVHSMLVLADSHKEIKRLNATKDKFFSIIAHDLKNPFSGIITYTNYFLEESSQKDFIVPDLKDAFNLIHDAADQGNRLLDNLLQWARSQRGHIPYEPRNSNLKELTNNSIAPYAVNAQSKSIAISNFIPEDLIAFIDNSMYETILRNLINNAIKFTPELGTIDVRAQQNKAEIIISVKDTGVGISEANIDKLFRIDEHHSTMGTAEEKGTGLGLILCKEFVELHGGSIEVKSKEQVGTTFVFTLPSQNIE